MVWQSDLSLNAEISKTIVNRPVDGDTTEALLGSLQCDLSLTHTRGTLFHAPFYLKRIIFMAIKLQFRLLILRTGFFKTKLSEKKNDSKMFPLQ